MKRQAGETLMGAKQHATNTYVRVADPTPLTGARPGTAVAIVASCVAAGGGAYCAVEGVPESLKAPVGLDRSQADTKPAPKPADARARRRAVAHPGTARPARRPAGAPAAARATPPAGRPRAATAQPAPAPPPVPENEFEPTPQAASPESAARHRPRPAQPATPAPAAGRRRGVLAVNRPVTAVSPGGPK